MTAQQQTDAYQFFIVAFGAAPGTVYMDQLNDAYGAGLTTKQIVNIYTTKDAFTARYPDFLANADFATSLTNYVVGNSASAAAKAEAVADITAALNAGLSRGDVIFNVFTNLANKDRADATWGNTAKQFDNQVAVAKFVTQDQLVSSTDTATLRGFLNGVTQDVATVQTAKDAASGASGKTFSLTAGVDTGAAFTGSAGNDTFNASPGASNANTFSALDNIDGGAGIDTLNVTEIGAAGASPYALNAAATVKNVEVLNYTVASDDVGDTLTADVSSYSGLTTATFTIAGTDAAMNIDTKGNVTAATLVGGDSDVDVGTGVDIADGATTDALTSVTLSAMTDSDATTADAVTIASDVLNTLKIVNSAVGATVTAAAGARALTVNLDGVTGGTVTDAQATTLSVASSGTKTTGVTLAAAKATTVTIDAAVATTIADVTIAAATSLTAKGAGAVTITATTTVTALTSIDATASTGGLNVGAAIGNGVTFTGGAGKDSVLVGATTKAIVMGAGDDTVTITGVSALGTGGSIDAGAGTGDTIKFSTYANAVTATATAPFALTVSNFEKLDLAGVNAAAGAVVNLANLDNINFVTLSAKNTETTTIAGMSSGGTIAFTSDQTAGKDATVSIVNANTGMADVLNVALSKATALAAVELIAADVETINVISTETATTLLGTVTHALELNATGAKALTVAGNAGVTFGTLTGATALTSIDASDVTTGLVSLTTAALASAATITGGAGANTVVATAATKAVTYVGGDKVDTITIDNAQANVISTGAGNDIIVVGSGANTINAGAGDDTITVGASAGLTTINVGAGTDTVVLGAIQTAAGFYTSVTGMTAGDKIDFAAVTAKVSVDGALGAKIVLGGAASFANYLDAAAASNTAAGTAAVFKSFEFGGNTYVVVDNSDTTTFADGVDSVIELVGVVNLATSTVAADVLTIV
jgi:S-layer protein